MDAGLAAGKTLWTVVTDDPPFLHGLPGGSAGKEPACQRRRRKRHRFSPSLRKTPGGGMAAHFPGDSAGKEPACNVGDLGWIPRSGRPLEGAWQPTSSGALLVRNPPAMRETWVGSLSQEDPWKVHGSPLHHSCLKNSHGQRRLVGRSPWGHRVGCDCSGSACMPLLCTSVGFI